MPDQCVPGATTIQDVQGDGFVSPLNGQTVSKVEGIVTGVRSGTSHGFWMQEAHPSSDASASCCLHPMAQPVVATDNTHPIFWLAHWSMPVLSHRPSINCWRVPISMSQ